MAKIVVVISYDTKRLLHPEKLVKRIARAVHPIFMQKANVEVGVTEGYNAERILVVLADERGNIGSLEDPDVRPRNTYRQVG